MTAALTITSICTLTAAAGWMRARHILRRARPVLWKRAAATPAARAF